ncbi:hypothetical protein ACIRBX_08395 [Kitasatospora sp. NPDC096147]|uniref:hypothetical protein n=1 Tax=Kitasatospora sp. NPDC096147 TaxID=3364093 RepID=UPI0038248464
MDYRKLDAALARTVDSVGDPKARNIAVVIRLVEAASEQQQVLLRAAGVVRSAAGRRVLTANMSREDVEALSALPWVRALSLSESRQPLTAPL